MNGQIERSALKSLVAGRDVYIWGAGQQGRGVGRLLERLHLSLVGFIDSSSELQGSTVQECPVLSPEAVRRLAEQGARRPFVIVAAFFFDGAIMEACEAFGWRPGVDFISYKQIRPLDYVVEISGVCNLRCPACPRAGRFALHPAAGFMNVETFRRVLDKILVEDPLAGSVQLYQWGEPLLNPDLPQIICAASEKGLPTAISSNLSMEIDLEPVIAAAPDRFRVSVSGFGDDYEIMHRRGKWERLQANMRELARLREMHAPAMKTEVYYHLYKYNQGESFAQMKRFCQDLGFEFRPVWAYLISLDDILEHLEGGELSTQAQQAVDKLSLSLDEGIALARAERDETCQVMRCVYVNWNLNVHQCMLYFYPQDNVVADNFLETPLEEITALRDAHALCGRCAKQGLHRYCSVYARQPVPTEPATT